MSIQNLVNMGLGAAAAAKAVRGSTKATSPINFKKKAQTAQFALQNVAYDKVKSYQELNNNYTTFATKNTKFARQGRPTKVWVVK